MAELFGDSEMLFQGPKGAFVLYDYVTSIAAMVVNIVVLHSVIKTRIHLTGYKYFLVSLGVSDLFLSIINIAIFIIEGVRQYDIDSFCSGQIFRSLQMSGFIANLLNLIGMSFDHLIGIVFPFAYDRVMRKSTVKICVAVLWLTAFVLGSAELPTTTVLYLFQEPKKKGADDVMATAADCLSLNRSWSKNLSSDSAQLDDMTSLVKAMLGSDSWALDFPLVSNQSAPASNLTMESLDLPPAVGGSGPADSVMPDWLNESASNASSFEFSCMFNKLFSAVGSSQHNKDQPQGWCGFYRKMPYLEYAIMGLTLLCFIFVIFCYCQIFLELFSKSEHAKRKIRKLVTTTLLLLGIFAICYLPFMIFELIMVLAMHFGLRAALEIPTTFPHYLVVNNIFNSLLITSPLIQPLLYAGRLSTVRRQIVRDLEHSFCCSWMGGHRHNRRRRSTMESSGLFTATNW